MAAPQLLMLVTSLFATTIYNTTMTSMQATTGSSKAAKFAAANPLGPMADPFAGLTDDERDYQKALSENIQKRMETTIKEMQEREHQHHDDPDFAPTGEPYRAMQRQALLQQEQERLEAQQQNVEKIARIKSLKENVQNQKNNESDCDDSDDDDWLLDDDNDPTLESIRQARLQQLKQQQVQHAENMAKGHGQYRTISQDEFLPECTSSHYVVVHFFHDEFERCKIMDFHVKKIVPLYTSVKFVRINATKAPFFVDKLKIKTLPTLLVFQDGKTIRRLVGFDGLVSNDPKKPDEWHTSQLEQWLHHAGVIEYKKPTEVIQEEMQRLGLTPRGAIWRGGVKEYDQDDE